MTPIELCLCISAFLLVCLVVTIVLLGVFYDAERRYSWHLRKRLFHAAKVKQCIIEQARRWKQEAKENEEVCGLLQASCKHLSNELNTLDRSAAATADNRDHWKAIATEEIARNSRAFDAGVRAHATGVVPYTGDEPEGVRL